MAVQLSHLLLLVAGLLAAAPARAASDPYTGRWVLDAEGSRSGATTQILTISVDGAAETYRSEMQLADGRRQVTEYRARYDETDYPSRTAVTAPGRPPTEETGSVRLRRIDALTRERVWMRNGAVWRILHRKVSTDLRTMTSQIEDVTEAGTSRGALLIFRRAPE